MNIDNRTTHALITTGVVETVETFQNLTVAPLPVAAVTPAAVRRKVGASINVDRKLQARHGSYTHVAVFCIYDLFY